MRNSLVLLLTFLVSQFSLAANQVFVATNREQPPFSTAADQGLVNDLMDALNVIQNQYEFVVAHVVSDRAKKGLENGTYDMVAMSNINWGYQGLSAQSSADLLEVQDQFFALSSSIADDSYFSQVGSGLSTSVVRGFSYQFLNFEKDTKILKEKYNTTVVLDEPTVVKMVLTGRANVGVSSSTNLQYFSSTNPEDHKKLSISEKFDSSYKRHFIVSDASSISVDEFNGFLVKLSENGTLKTLFKKYGLVPAM